MKLENKVAIITGGNSGLGFAMAQEFSNEGACVIIVNRTREIGIKAAEEIRKRGGKAEAIPADVSRSSQVAEMVRRIKDKFGRIDILVNNAGVTKQAMLHQMTQDQWDEVISINLKGCFNCIRYASEVMIPRRYGRILNISSVAGQRGTIGRIHYSAAKAGVHGLTKSAAKELACYNITVNAIAAGLFDTPMSRNIMNNIPEALKKRRVEEIPLKRMGQAWELAKLALFLVSDDAAYITGQVIGINGGAYM